jgi:type IV pilus assembly protein PilB
MLPGTVGRLPPEKTTLSFLEWTQPQPEHKVLILGVMNSFLTAIYSRLVQEVFVVLRRKADRTLLRRQLVQTGGGNVRIRADAKLRAWEGHGPFDTILAGQISEADLEGLRWEMQVGGVLVHLERTGPALLRPVMTWRLGSQQFETQSFAELALEAELGDVLTMLGLIEESALELARQQGAVGAELGRYLVEHALLPEADLTFAQALIHGYGHASVESLLSNLDLEVVRSMPRVFLQHQGIVPLRMEEEFVVVALRSSDADLAEIEPAFHPRRVAPYIVTENDYRRLWMSIDLKIAAAESGTTISHDPGNDGETEDPDHAPDGDMLVEVESSAHLERGEASSKGSILHFNSILIDAIARRASDIHLEFTRGGAQVRLRIDGGMVPYDGMRLSESDLGRLVNVFKIQAELSISERRVPQGGSIRVRVHKSLFDLRVQTQPTLFGENAVIRILPQDMRAQSIEELGFPDDVAQTYTRVLKNPSGLVLVVGPTGSGKSTTLYAGLDHLSRDGLNKVVTIEDPIEYCLPKVQQSQVNAAAGFHFSDAIRSFLRQDPDVMLVGEIRDAETAKEAIRASQTGHLVLSTLHCNESTDAVQRLMDLGTDAPSIASELQGVLSQRLARRICRSCRFETTPDEELVDIIFPNGVPSGMRFWSGRGCSRCGGTGIQDRIAVIEFLPVDDELREVIVNQATAHQLRFHAHGNGLVTMRSRAIELVKEGVIALDDMPRFLPLHRLGPEI